MRLIRSHRVYLFEKCIIVRYNKFDGSDLGGEIAMWFWWFMLVCDLLTPIVLVKQKCNIFPQKYQAKRFCQGVRPLLNE